MAAGDPVTRYPLINDTIRCLDPRDVAAVCIENGWALGDIERCNSLNVPVGMEAGRGYFVIKPTETIDVNAWHTIEWLTEAGHTEWQNYCVIKRYACGGDVNGNAPTIVEFADKRHVLKMSYANKDYNIRRPCPYAASPVSDASWYTDSLNSGTPWTWSGLLSSLWSYLPAIAGDCPTLHWSPTSPPENYNVHGSAWDAIGKLIEQCQSILVLDPQADEFSIVRIGEEQAGLTAAIAAVPKLFTAAPETDASLAVIPEKIVFVAKKQRLDGGDETENPADGGITVNPWYEITYDTEIAGAEVGTKLEWFIDIPALLAADGWVENCPEIKAYVDELLPKILARWDLGTERQLIFVPGIASTLPLGSQVHNHLYRDYGDQGLVTEVRYNPELGLARRPLPEDTQCDCCEWPVVFHNASGQTVPAFGVMQIISAYHADGVVYYTIIQPNGFGKDFLINGGRDVAPDFYGRGQWLIDSPGWALHDGDSVFGQRWTPILDSWKLGLGGTAYFAYGDIIDERGRFRRVAVDEVFEAVDTGVTTTTAQDCAGRCKWEWDGYEWTEVTNECGGTTTTTTTTSTTTTTAGPTTTCNPADICCRPTTTTTTAGATTTTTAGPTTTASHNCRCQYPIFCPDTLDIGACAWTFCADGEPQIPPCQTTTTAAPTTTAAGTGPPTTTGTPTTTAGCPGDCLCPTGASGCEWIGLPSFGGGWYWHQTNDPCCITCPCSPPSTSPADCATANTDCVPLPPPTPPVTSCTGTCEFWWIPTLGRWVQTQGNCVGVNVAYCNCAAPTVDGDVCGPMVTKCKSPTIPTTTNPYSPCFATTTAGATTTSTTTTPECGGGCEWECDTAVWVEALNECNPGCECYSPAINCVENCEREYTACRSSTTTPGPTTTAAPTTTTTTTAAPTTTQSECTACTAGTASYQWKSSVVIPGWYFVAATCNYPCTPLPPNRPGAYNGEIAAGTCHKQCYSSLGCTWRSWDGLTWTLVNRNDCASRCNCEAMSYAPTYVNEYGFNDCGCP